MVKKISPNYIDKMASEVSKNNMISYEELPKYDLFLSQVIDFLNDKFMEDNYTNNIVQNYIKSEVISKPEDGKKRGYTKIHLAQLVLLSHMRPVLTTEEIKKVFSMAFNDINDRDDDIISWEDAYKIFDQTKNETFDNLLENSIVSKDKLNDIISKLELNDKDKNSVNTFLMVMSLIAQASAIKKLAQKIVKDYYTE